METLSSKTSTTSNSTPSHPQPTLKEPTLRDLIQEFSLVAGGPFSALLVQLKLLHPPLDGLLRSTIAIVLFAWLPLCLIVLNTPGQQNVTISFWHDLELHIRLLLSLPVFLLAEAPIHRCLRKTVAVFIDEEIISSDNHSYFRNALLKLKASRDSYIFEGALFLLVYTVGPWVRWENMAPTSDAWFAVRENGAFRFSSAGLWYSIISIPLLQFVQLRWYLRLCFWYAFLWRISRLKLNLTPNHPDRAAGIGFLGDGTAAFAPVLFAHGVGLSGMLADKIIYDGMSLLSYRIEIVAALVVLLISFLGPLFAFLPQLFRSRWDAKHEFAGFTNHFLQAFNQKWVRERGAKEDSVENVTELLSTSDIQNQANISASFQAISEMRPVPFDRRLVIIFIVATILPMLPLALTVVSAGELVERVCSALL